MNQHFEALAILPKLSEGQLLQVLQSNNGSVPAYAVMAELQSRKKRMAASQGADGAPASTVKDEMSSQGGLQSLTSQQGGARGFADGGLLENLGYGKMDGYNEADLPESLGARLKRWLAGEGSVYEYPAAPAAKPSTAGERIGTERGRASNPSKRELPAAPRGPDIKAMPQAPAGGLQSLRVSASSKAPGPAAPAPAGFAFEPVKLRSINEAMGDVPLDASITEQMKALRGQDEDFDKRRGDARSEALIRAGLTMAMTPGGIGRAGAAGGLEGLNSLGASMKGISGDRREQQRELAELARAQAAQNMQRYGIANTTRFGEAGISDKNQDNRFQAYRTGVESADRRYSADQQLKAAYAAAASRGASSSNRLPSLLLQADTTARASVDKTLPLGLKVRMSSADPTVKASAQREYNALVENARRDKVAQLSLVEPDLMSYYTMMRQQMDGADQQGPAIIRGGGPPPGAVIRQ